MGKALIPKRIRLLRLQNNFALKYWEYVSNLEHLPVFKAPREGEGRSAQGRGTIHGR